MTKLTPLLLALFVSTPSLAKVNIVATVSDLGVIAREVGGDLVQVNILAKNTQDPHFVDPKPSLVVQLSRAELLLFVGMDLEIGWLPALLTSSRNPAIQPGSPGSMDCSTLIAPLDVPQGKVDRSMGDLHPGGNPHYSKDPRNGVLLGRGIAKRLAELDPPNAQAYLEGGERFATNLEAKIPRWEARLKSQKGQPVVTYHKSFIYFTTWVGMQEVGYIEPKPGLPPSTSHVAKMLQTMRSMKVKLILQESWYSGATSELLAAQTGARLVRIPGMADPAQSYGSHFELLVSEVAGTPAN